MKILRLVRGLLLLFSLFFADSGYSKDSVPEPVLQVGHQKKITCASCSSDGRYLLTGSLDGFAILWDAESGRQLRAFHSVSGVVTGVAFSPDCQRLAICGKDEISLWECATGKRIQVFRPKHVQGNVTFSPNGKYLLIEVPRLGHAGIAQAIIFDADTGRFRTVSHGKPGADSRDDISARFSPDGKFILTGSDDKVAVLWTTENCEKVRSFEGHGGPVTTVAFSADGKRVATGSADKKVFVWEAATGKKLLSFNGRASVTAIVFNRDGNSIAAGYENGAVSLWHATKPEEIHQLKTTDGAPSAVEFRPGHAELMAVSGHKLDKYGWCIDVWDTKTGKNVRNQRGPIVDVGPIIVSQNGRFLLTGGLFGRVGLWDITKGSRVASLKGHHKETNGLAKLVFLVAAREVNNSVTQVAVSQDGRKGFSADLNGVTIIWDLEAGKKLHECNQGFAIASLVISPDAERFYAATAIIGRHIGGPGKPGEIVAWEVKTGKKVFSFTPEGDKGVTCLAVNIDGKKLWAGFEDGSVIVWDAGTGKRLDIRKPHKERVVSVIFSPDGKRVVTASEDKTIELWDARDLVWQRSFGDKTYTPTSVAISPDNKSLLIGSWSTQEPVTLWDISTGKKQRSFNSEMGVDEVAFGSEGRLALTTNRNGTVGIWDVTTGEECVRLVGFGNDDWAVLDPRGVFDVSPKSRERVMYRLDGKLDVRPQPERLSPGLLAQIWKGQRPALKDAGKK